MNVASRTTAAFVTAGGLGVSLLGCSNFPVEAPTAPDLGQVNLSTTRVDVVDPNYVVQAYAQRAALVPQAKLSGHCRMVELRKDGTERATDCDVDLHIRAGGDFRMKLNFLVFTMAEMGADTRDYWLIEYGLFYNSFYRGTGEKFNVKIFEDRKIPIFFNPCDLGYLVGLLAPPAGCQVESVGQHEITLSAPLPPHPIGGERKWEAVISRETYEPLRIKIFDAAGAEIVRCEMGNYTLCNDGDSMQKVAFRLPMSLELGQSNGAHVAMRFNRGEVASHSDSSTFAAPSKVRVRNLYNLDLLKEKEASSP